MSKQESVLSYLLSKAGKTFKDLANYVGVEESTPYRWSRGTRTPSGQAWGEVESFLEEECGFDLRKILPYGSSFSKYLAVSMDSVIGNDIKIGVERFYKRPCNTLEQFLDTLRDGYGKEVELPKRNLKEALENPDTIKPHIHYVGNQFAQGGRLCGKPHEPNEETKAALDECTADRLSREGISLHGGGSGCVAIKGIVVPRKITDLIEERFRESFKHPQSHQQFIEMVECYTRYVSVTGRD